LIVGQKAARGCAKALLELLYCIPRNRTELSVGKEIRPLSLARCFGRAPLALERRSRAKTPLWPGQARQAPRRFRNHLRRRKSDRRGGANIPEVRLHHIAGGLASGLESGLEAYCRAACFGMAGRRRTGGEIPRNSGRPAGCETPAPHTKIVWPFSWPKISSSGMSGPFGSNRIA
jgi:hypothetical protein